MNIWNCRLCNFVKKLWSTPQCEEVETKPPKNIQWQNFNTHYIQYKESNIKSLVNEDGRIGKETTIRFRDYYSRDGTPNTEYCYIFEFVSYFHHNQRKFIITLTGISNPEFPPTSLSRIEDFPARERDIHGCVLTVQEISDDWSMATEGITFVGIEDVALAFHKKTTEQVIKAVDNSEPISQVIDRAWNQVYAPAKRFKF